MKLISSPLSKPLLVKSWH